MAGSICIALRVNRVDQTATSHAGLMDQVYRNQRRFYDATRKYYLLGRDHLVQQMQPKASATILEIACGTGRNLDQIDRRYPMRQLYGLDISEQMLTSARAKLAGRAKLAQADACDFDAVHLFGRSEFDHIVLSYSLSMIPDWEKAVAEAARYLAKGGRLYIVDFGDQAGLPSWFKAGLRRWLAKFHVSPRDGLDDVLSELAVKHGLTVHTQKMFRGYARYATLTRPG